MNDEHGLTGVIRYTMDIGKKTHDMSTLQISTHPAPSPIKNLRGIDFETHSNNK